jgi:hypothetical protein
MILKQDMTNVIYHALKGKVEADRVYQLIEVPKHAHLGTWRFLAFN